MFRVLGERCIWLKSFRFGVGCVAFSASDGNARHPLAEISEMNSIGKRTMYGIYRFYWPHIGRIHGKKIKRVRSKLPEYQKFWIYGAIIAKAFCAFFERCITVLVKLSSNGMISYS